jgi:hypothetical protein
VAPFDIYSGNLDAPQIDANLMPLLDGTGKGAAITLADYTIVRNMQVYGYYTGIAGSRFRYATIDNILVTDCLWYGIRLEDCDYCQVLNSVASDCEMADIGLLGPRYSLIENSRGHDMPGGIVTDYYIVLLGYSRDAFGNTIRHCYAENDHLGNDGVSGHGIGLKGYNYQVYDTTVEDCVSWTANECFFAAHSGVFNNTFRNSIARDAGLGRADCNAMMARDGAHDNLFSGIWAQGTTVGAKFYTTGEDSREYSALNNRFENCILENNAVGVIHEVGARAQGNVFQNCTFSSNSNWGVVRYVSSGNATTIRNSIVAGFSTFEEYQGGTGSIDVSYSCFWDNGFAAPGGTGVFEADPLFVDAPNSVFRLEPESPAIDTGSPASAPAFDIEGVPRPQGPGWDLGAYEAP